MKQTMTYKIAMAAATDAANSSMRLNGRTAWNDEDYEVAVDMLAKLLGPIEERRND